MYKGIMEEGENIWMTLSLHLLGPFCVCLASRVSFFSLFKWNCFASSLWQRKVIIFLSSLCLLEEEERERENISYQHKLRHQTERKTMYLHKVHLREEERERRRKERQDNTARIAVWCVFFVFSRFSLLEWYIVIDFPPSFSFLGFEFRLLLFDWRRTWLTVAFLFVEEKRRRISITPGQGEEER